VLNTSGFFDLIFSDKYFNLPRMRNRVEKRCADEKALKINPQYYMGWYNKEGNYFDLGVYTYMKR